MLGTGQKKAEEAGDKAGAHAEGAKKEGKGAWPAQMMHGLLHCRPAVVHMRSQQ